MPPARNPQTDRDDQDGRRPTRRQRPGGADRRTADPGCPMPPLGFPARRRFGVHRNPPPGGVRHEPAPPAPVHLDPGVEARIGRSVRSRPSHGHAHRIPRLVQHGRQHRVDHVAVADARDLGGATHGWFGEPGLGQALRRFDALAILDPFGDRRRAAPDGLVQRASPGLQGNLAQPDTEVRPRPGRPHRDTRHDAVLHRRHTVFRQLHPDVTISGGRHRHANPFGEDGPTDHRGAGRQRDPGSPLPRRPVEPHGDGVRRVARGSGGWCSGDGHHGPPFVADARDPEGPEPLRNVARDVADPWRLRTARYRCDTGAAVPRSEPTQPQRRRRRVCNSPRLPRVAERRGDPEAHPCAEADRRRRDQRNEEDGDRDPVSQRAPHRRREPRAD
jgi:hypothetical protein